MHAAASTSTPSATRRSAAPEITTLHRHDLSNAMSPVTTAMQVPLMTPNPESGALNQSAGILAGHVHLKPVRIRVARAEAGPDANWIGAGGLLRLTHRSQTATSTSATSHQASPSSPRLPGSTPMLSTVDDRRGTRSSPRPLTGPRIGDATQRTRPSPLHRPRRVARRHEVSACEEVLRTSRPGTPHDLDGGVGFDGLDPSQNGDVVRAGRHRQGLPALQSGRAGGPPASPDQRARLVVTRRTSWRWRRTRPTGERSEPNPPAVWIAAEGSAEGSLPETLRLLHAAQH